MQLQYRPEWKQIASDWHGGQWSALYSFLSSSRDGIITRDSDLELLEFISDLRVELDKVYDIVEHDTAGYDADQVADIFEFANWTHENEAILEGIVNRDE